PNRNGEKRMTKFESGRNGAVRIAIVRHSGFLFFSPVAIRACLFFSALVCPAVGGVPPGTETAYFGSLTCLRTAAKSFVIPVRLTRLAMKDGIKPPVSVKMKYVARVLFAPSGSSSHLPSQIFTRTTPFFSGGPSSFAGDQ